MYNAGKVQISTPETHATDSETRSDNFFVLIYFYFWLHWVFVAARGLPLAVGSRVYSSLQCAWASPCGGFSYA